MFNLQVTSTTMELLPLVCLCLLTRSGTTFAEEGPKLIKVEEGSDVTLPCSLSSKEDIELKLFVWKKDGQKEVFLYDAGTHYNNGRAGQDEQFRGRVSHFQDELNLGDASIKIRNMKVTDSGNYTCDFPRLQPSQIFHIRLVVGAAPKPYVTVLKTKDWTLLLCVVQDASPKPEVEWQDRAGNILPAEETQVSERGGSYDIILQTTVTKTDIYRCVATQEDISHQTNATIYVDISGAAPKPYVTILDATNDWTLLQCEVLEASPKPEVEWQDSAGNILPAEEPQVSERGGRYDIILQTTVTKTDIYRCVATQEDINHQTDATIYVDISGSKVIRVEEGNDVTLPCSLSSKEDIELKFFDWRKDGQKEVFLYEAGLHYNNGRAGQDEQFKGRVSHFQDELKHGDASIKIRNTKLTDSGDYTCAFPLLQPSQIFHIWLVVGGLKDRSGENIPGAVPKPYVTILNTNDRSLLQCEVLDASSKPKVEWQDSAGNILPAEEPQVSRRGGRYNITLNTTVTKTDRYRCVATQEDISHQIYAETYMYIPGFPTGWIVAVSVLCALLVGGVVLLSWYYYRRRSTQNSQRGSSP